MNEFSIARWSLFAHAEHDCLARNFPICSMESLFAHASRYLQTPLV
ncbi:hypothetical protein T01_8818 [Trichinella spiralis]|uniref:Uncharacterized protein n=1 Tax=Trichinella spiralis TaxID=6334 RepID=A0A0V0Z767_TRISP|nr:hypothetical protein T01_8818 [Trichinella spiralis]